MMLPEIEYEMIMAYSLLDPPNGAVLVPCSPPVFEDVAHA